MKAVLAFGSSVWAQSGRAGVCPCLAYLDVTFGGPFLAVPGTCIQLQSKKPFISGCNIQAWSKTPFISVTPGSLQRLARGLRKNKTLREIKLRGAILVKIRNLTLPRAYLKRDRFWSLQGLRKLGPYFFAKLRFGRSGLYFPLALYRKCLETAWPDGLGRPLGSNDEFTRIEAPAAPRQLPGNSGAAPGQFRQLRGISGAVPTEMQFGHAEMNAF